MIVFSAFLVQRIFLNSLSYKQYFSKENEKKSHRVWEKYLDLPNMKKMWYPDHMKYSYKIRDIKE